VAARATRTSDATERGRNREVVGAASENVVARTSDATERGRNGEVVGAASGNTVARATELPDATGR